MNLTDESHDKWSVLRQIKDELILQSGFIMDDVDEHKPWGAYYRFLTSQKDAFVDRYFPELSGTIEGSINPKFLVFEPGRKISLQYHERRDEIWTVVYGEVEAWFGDGDEVGEYKIYGVGESFTYHAGMRHKGGASQSGWAIVAEMWEHTDQTHLSDEADNTRISDDFGRA